MMKEFLLRWKTTYFKGSLDKFDKPLIEHFLISWKKSLIPDGSVSIPVKRHLLLELTEVNFGNFVVSSGLLIYLLIYWVESRNKRRHGKIAIN